MGELSIQQGRSCPLEPAPDSLAGGGYQGGSGEEQGDRKENPDHNPDNQGP